jgi:hypothetical protein
MIPAVSHERPHISGRWSVLRLLTVVGAVALFAGMLFWTKLRLVSDIPRSAYAVPKAEAAPPAEEAPESEPEREEPLTDPDPGPDGG